MKTHMSEGETHKARDDPQQFQTVNTAITILSSSFPSNIPIIIFHMGDFPELPLIINEATRQKYSRYTIYESLPKCPKKPLLPKRQSRNPFECLIRNPHLTGKLSYGNLKSLHLSRSRIDCASSLDFSLLPTLPPLTSVTAPRGSALKAYEEVLGFARDYLKGCGEQTMAELTILRNLHGGVHTLNGRMQDIVRSGLVVLDPVLNIIFQSLQAELALRQERMADAGLHFRKAQFYSFKMEQYLFAGHCLIQQAEIYKSEGRLQRGLASLKKGLGMAILFGNQELQLIVLEKIGMLYYYNGNTAIGEQYHRYAERGLSPRELQMFRNQFCLQGELRLLQQELFSLRPSPQKPQTKQFSRYDAQVNSDLQAESVQKHSLEITTMVAHMLKDNQEKSIGAKFRKHIRNTMSLARITPYPHSPPLGTSSSKENLPFVNVAQVLKSHLSRNRGGTRIQRDWQVRTLLQMIDSLARCLG